MSSTYGFPDSNLFASALACLNPALGQILGTAEYIKLEWYNGWCTVNLAHLLASNHSQGMNVQALLFTY